ncbi:MAG: response regulator [Brasilonema octagenarum HA4186-MV1]|jgi:CheY-like chemotaxis protein|uniref:Two-component system response regulator n=2 Tax=Brasilonema TaxID=383614 RepID=A0A856MGZ5_9CYAN|nr:MULTISPECIES: response regulator [Brasilonema]MBW4628336.1 response regulator [Brasilonema octagenarum HA4186-MV1]NMF65976.1 two-component system response regulator [Brasilonema octagenarum UFV-OR1]QDL10493.1 two-component system response regulator [Brasilonema sennae CENA114]QDL16839.1 two-component system response regulator [Brasilonema octagenarum UFV-E1]
MLVKRVLVIDDEKNLCLVIKACLESIGHWQVLTALSGSEGVTLAETELPDAILLDVMMPDMDGLVVFHKLQQNSLTQKIPVILLTAIVQQVDLNQYAQLRIVGVIPKPFDPLKLVNRVIELVGWE